LRIIIRVETGNLPSLLISPLVPEKAAISLDLLEAYTELEAP
jgi:hypothetical protein